MSCRHRFYDILIPQRKGIRFLFIGTFNPEWDAGNGNNAMYFYGRSTNLFWCICPHSFNDSCLIDKGPEEWMSFCEKHDIGLTDIIKEVTNADHSNPLHKELITSYRDDNLDRKNELQYIFNLEFNTIQILKLIEKNRNSLKGVFFTRRGNSGIPRTWEQWELIKGKCENEGIYFEALYTPSTKGKGVKDKILLWRESINNCF